MPSADLLQRLHDLAETLHRWLEALAGLDQARRQRVSVYAVSVADTLARAVDALTELEIRPDSRSARTKALRELSRIAGYVETMVDALQHHLDGRKLAGVKRRLEQLKSSEIRAGWGGKDAPAIGIEKLIAAEGYFRALADGLKT
jgi:hypothetical protein